MENHFHHPRWIVNHRDVGSWVTSADILGGQTALLGKQAAPAPGPRAFGPNALGPDSVRLGFCDEDVAVR